MRAKRRACILRDQNLPLRVKRSGEILFVCRVFENQEAWSGDVRLCDWESPKSGFEPGADLIVKLVYDDWLNNRTHRPAGSAHVPSMLSGDRSQIPI